MPAYRGKDVVVLYNSVDISGDGRNISFEESADALDSSAYGDTRRTKVPGLEDAKGSFEALDTTGAWSAVWDAMAVGQLEELEIRPEGTGVGKRSLVGQCLITGRTLSAPYEDLATISLTFEMSGDVTEDVQ